MAAAVQSLRDGVDRLIVFGNREPVLTVRRVLWVLTFGWSLGVLYLAYAVAMLLSIVFAPFCYQALRLALLALDGGITLEPCSAPVFLLGEAPAWRNPHSWYTTTANVVWLALFGWHLALMHLAAGLVQALTIVGVGTALTQLQLAWFAVWPFGRTLHQRQLPTTLEELHHQRAQAAADEGSARLLGWL